MYRIKLPAADRDRYNVPEWIEFDIVHPRLSDMKAVQAQVGIGWSTLEDWHYGERDAKGKIKKEPSLDDRIAALGIIYWLAVRRHNGVTWDEFDCAMYDVEMERVDPNPPAPDGASTEPTT